MILKRPVLKKVVAGEIRVVFRRWVRPSVRSGGTLKTALGMLAIDRVQGIDPTQITEEDARSAGYPSRPALLSELAEREGTLYRVDLHYAGADPRIALRERRELAGGDIEELRRRLARLDAASQSGPWTLAVLKLIAARPAVRAALLAKQLGQEVLSFKRNVRKLKELGLTESLEIGYRLSPRGSALLDVAEAGAAST